MLTVMAPFHNHNSVASTATLSRVYPSVIDMESYKNYLLDFPELSATNAPAAAPNFSIDRYQLPRRRVSATKRPIAPPNAVARAALADRDEPHVSPAKMARKENVPPAVRGGNVTSEMLRPLRVDCSVEYELSGLGSLPLRSEPLLRIDHARWRQSGNGGNSAPGNVAQAQGVVTRPTCSCPPSHNCGGGGEARRAVGNQSMRPQAANPQGKALIDCLND